MAEKRRQKRHRRRLQVRYGTGEANKVGFVEDLSQSGLFIRAALVFPPRTVLQVELNPGTEERVLLEGSVMWAKKAPPGLIRKLKAGMGLRITGFKAGEEIFRFLLQEMAAKS